MLDSIAVLLERTMSIPSTLFVLSALTMAAAAEDRAATPPPSERSAPAACIDVEVNGERVPAWDCLQQHLAPRASVRPPARGSDADRLIRQPGNQMLQYNLEGTRQRMGNALGTSVQPQRPGR